MVPPPCFHFPRGPTGSDMGFLPLHGPWCDKHMCAHTHKHSFAGKSQWWPTEGQLYAGFPNDFMPREPSWPDPPMRITKYLWVVFSYFYSLFSNYAKNVLFVWRFVGLQWQGSLGTFLFKNRLAGCDGLTVISCSLFMNVSFHPGFTISVSRSPFHKTFIMTHVQALVRKLVPD